jgi:two-component system LytT family response regulator
MSRWKALVVDDEPLARANLQLALAESPRWLCVAACASGEEALTLLHQQPVDLLLLDVRMPRQSGLGLAAELHALKSPPLLVFVTAHADHALKAFDVEALDYVLKPFDGERFAAMLSRAERALAERRAQKQGGPADPPGDAAAGSSGAKHLHVRSVRSMEKVPIANILFIRSAGNYVELHTASGMLLHRSSLDAIAQALPAGQFIRVHRTALARASAITALTSGGDKTYVASLSNGADLPVSERFVAQVRKLFA